MKLLSIQSHLIVVLITSLCSSTVSPQPNFRIDDVISGDDDIISDLISQLSHLDTGLATETNEKTESSPDDISELLDIVLSIDDDKMTSEEKQEFDFSVKIIDLEESFTEIEIRLNDELIRSLETDIQDCDQFCQSVAIMESQIGNEIDDLEEMMTIGLNLERNLKMAKLYSTRFSSYTTALLDTGRTITIIQRELYQVPRDISSIQTKIAQFHESIRRSQSIAELALHHIRVTRHNMDSGLSRTSHIYIGYIKDFINALESTNKLIEMEIESLLSYFEESSNETVLSKLDFLGELLAKYGPRCRDLVKAKNRLSALIELTSGIPQTPIEGEDTQIASFQNRAEKIKSLRMAEGNSHESPCQALDLAQDTFNPLRYRLEFMHYCFLDFEKNEPKFSDLAYERYFAAALNHKPEASNVSDNIVYSNDIADDQYPPTSQEDESGDEDQSAIMAKIFRMAPVSAYSLARTLKAPLLVNPDDCYHEIYPDLRHVSCIHQEGKQFLVLDSPSPDLNFLSRLRDNHAQPISPSSMLFSHPQYIMNPRGIITVREQILNQFVTAVRMHCTDIIVGRYGCEYCHVSLDQIASIYKEAACIFANKGIDSIYICDTKLYTAIVKAQI